MTEIEKFCRDAARKCPDMHVKHEGGTENDDPGWKPRLSFYAKGTPAPPRTTFPGAYAGKIMLNEFEITTDWEDQPIEDKLRDAKRLCEKLKYYACAVRPYIPSWKRRHEPGTLPWMKRDEQTKRD